MGRRIAANTVGQQNGRILPVWRHRTGLGKVVAGAQRYDAQGRWPVRLHYAVYGLVNAAIAARDHDFLGAPVDMQLNLFFNIAPTAALDDFMIDFVGMQQIT